MRSLAVVAFGVGLGVHFAPSQAATVVCPQTSTPTSWSGTILNTDTTKNGTTFISGSNRIELSKAGEVFNTKQMTSTSDTVYAAVADFNKDGWPDFIGAPQNVNSGISVFRNFTWQNENCTTAACTAYSGTQPNWADPTAVVTPKFTVVRTLGSYSGGRFSLMAADFNGDTWPDVFVASAPDTASDAITKLDLYLNTGSNDASGNPQFGSAYTANSFGTISNVLGNQTFSGTNIKAVDYNKDGKQDLLFGTDKGGGSIRILLNNCPGTMQASGVFKCSSNPQFTDGGNLITGLNSGNDGFGTGINGGLPIFDYADIDLDGLPDLVVGAANCCTTATMRARLYKGCSGGTGCTAGLPSSPTSSIAFNGAATAIFIADFSLDGKPDLVMATDGKNYNQTLNGGTSFYYRNNGTTSPFSGGVTQQLTYKGTTSGLVDDYDVGIIFDYDRDPTASPDIMVANGNDTSGYYIIADRISTKYVDCGDAYSGIVDLGTLLSQEMVVTAARMTPTVTLNGGTATFYMTNEDPANWVQASLCTGSTTDYCVSFPKAIGRSVRWKAYMCSNALHTQTPNLGGMSMKFDYTAAKEHYRAGTIVQDGIVYVGAFHQPGDRGKFYGLPAGLTNSTSYWEVGAKLETMSDSARNIYTAASNLAVRLDFTAANASNALLQNVLTTADTTSTSDLVTWARSSRFGLGTTQFPLQRLGSVETSTPAILAKPGKPNWYSFVTPLDRTRIDSFISSKATRKPLVLFGAKDGMIHAIHTRPSETPGNALNGKEAWAFIPPTVAKGMLADKTATSVANAAANNGTNNPKVTSYPDGSPMLVDIHAGNGVYKTIAAVAEGNGGKSVTVLDVTETVNPTTDVVIGPTPLWSATPGDSEAGQAYAKPALARVLISNTERYLIIAATGPSTTDVTNTKGRIVSAYDALTGDLIWKFQAACPVTSDPIVFETDDVLDGNDAPSLNGFADRVVFADKCGYVYKLAPNRALSGGYNDNVAMAGSCTGTATDCVGGKILASTATDGTKQYALFSTQRSTGALGAQRPIAGTIAARTDSSTRMVLFFGTGGIESVASNLTNEFYAVYADTGAIRSKVTGTCGTNGCEKFYGGVLVTPDQVILTKTVDPVIGNTTCDTGSSTILGLQLNANASGQFTSSGITQAISSAVMGGMFGDAGAIYFATLAGDVARIGTPRALTAGADTSANVSQGMGTGDQGTGGSASVGTTAAFTLIGWRVVL